MTKIDTNALSIGGRIKRKRSEARMSQSQLAEATGIAVAQLSRYESGKNAPRAEALGKIAAALNVSFDWLSAGYGTPDVVAVSADGNQRIVMELKPDRLQALREKAIERGVTVDMLLLEAVEAFLENPSDETLTPDIEALADAVARRLEQRAAAKKKGG